MHYVILNVIFYALYECNGVRFTFSLSSFINHMQNDVQYDVMCDANLSEMSLKFK